MSDLESVLKRIQDLTHPQIPGIPGGLTPAEQESLPFVQQASQEYTQEKQSRPLLKIVFDVLQTGNFMTAGAADAMVKSIQAGQPASEVISSALEGVWRGLTWQDQKTFKNVLLDNMSPEERAVWEQPILGEGTRGKPFIGASKADLLGFLGDVALDPLTYVNPLKFFSVAKGASTLGRSVATQYAEDTVKVALAQKKIGELVKLGAKRLDAEGMVKAAQKGGNVIDDVYNYISKHPGDDFSRYLTELVKGAQKEAYTGTAESLTSKMQGRLTEMTSEIGKAFEGKRSLSQMKKYYSQLESAGSTVAPFLEPGRYAGAGERANRILGHEFNVGVRPPNLLARSFDSILEKARSTEVGSKLGDAWYAIMNTGVVGQIKRALGVRNPYQELLNVKKVAAKDYADKVVFDLTAHVNSIISDVGDDTFSKEVQIWAFADQLEKMAAKEGKPVLPMAQLLDHTDAFPGLAALKLTPEEITTIKGSWSRIDELFKHLRTTEQQLVDQGIIKDYAEIVNYFPKNQQVSWIAPGKGKAIGTAQPGFTKATQYSAHESIEQGVAKLKLFYGDLLQKAAQEAGYVGNAGYEQFLRQFVIEKNLAPISTDVRQLLNARIVAHARAVQRGEIVKSFRPFGIDGVQLGLARGAERQSIMRPGQGIAQLGLIPVSDPAFTNMLFDREVAGIIDKVYQINANDDSIRAFQRLIGGMTSWWKGLVTMTSGFHMRNFISNNVTGFFRHGFEWFNPQKMLQGWVGTIYALNPAKYLDILKGELKIDDGMIARVLNSRIGDHTIKELADYARDKGVISAHTFFSDAEKKVGTSTLAQKVNPFSLEFAGTKGSRWVGDHIENASKFQSFLMTMDELARPGDIGQLGMKLEFAKSDTKKWFIDYNDLTEFERRVMKNIVPFYTWLRKNLANQLSGITMFPEMYALSAKAQRTFTQDENFDYELLPDWQKALGYFPVGTDTATGNPIMFFPNFPYQDVNKIPLEFQNGQPVIDTKGLIDDLMSQAHPLIKTMVETITGYNTFKRRDYLSQVQAPNLLQFFSKSPKVLRVLDGAMRMAGFENGIRADVKDGKVVMDEQMQRLLATNFPILQLMGQIVDTGIDVGQMMGTGLEQAIQAATGRKDDYQGLADFFQTLSYYGGVKLSEFQTDYEKQQRAYDVEKRADELKRAARQKLPGYAQRSLAARLRTVQRQKRLGIL